MAQQSTQELVDHGTPTGALTIDWNDGIVQKLTIPADQTLTIALLHPSATGRYRLVIDRTKTSIIVWPTSVKFGVKATALAAGEPAEGPETYATLATDVMREIYQILYIEGVYYILNVTAFV